MTTVNIRKQGGAAVITIPSGILKILGIRVGSKLELNVTEEGFIAHPTKRNRYTLNELLHGTTPKKMKAINEKTKWAREGKSVGRELT